jgi:hypothetical protein
MTHSLTMNWANKSGLTFVVTGASHTHGTTPTFTPSGLGANGNSSVFVDQSANLGPGPVGVYTWTSGTVTAGCSYNHPSGTGQTTVTVTPNGCQVSFDGSNWSTQSITSHPTGTNITMSIYISP